MAGVVGGENVGIPGLCWFCVTAPWGMGGGVPVFVVWLLLVWLWCWVGVGGVGLVVFGVCFRHAGGGVCFQGFVACWLVWVCVGVWVGVG